MGRVYSKRGCQKKKRSKASNKPWPCLSILIVPLSSHLLLGAMEISNDVISVRYRDHSSVTWHSHPVIARAAIDGAVILGYEWHLRLGSTLGANDCMHFAWATLWTTTRAARCTTRWATCRTTTGLIQQAFLLVKLLFTRGEREVITAFPAPEGFVNETQLGTSLWYVSILPGPYPNRCHQFVCHP